MKKIFILLIISITFSCTLPEGPEKIEEEKIEEESEYNYNVNHPGDEPDKLYIL